MRVLVTGARGKVGRALCPRLLEAGYDVRATDLAVPTWDRADPGEPEDYWQADLTDAGSTYSLARACDAVVHTAAIPQPIHNPPHVVFGNNIMSTFNTLEAAIASGARLSRKTHPMNCPAVRARLPPDRRGAPRSATGRVRDREVVRRASLRSRNRAL